MPRVRLGHRALREACAPQKKKNKYQARRSALRDFSCLWCECEMQSQLSSDFCRCGVADFCRCGVAGNPISKPPSRRNPRDLSTPVGGASAAPAAPRREPRSSWPRALGDRPRGLGKACGLACRNPNVFSSEVNFRALELEF